MSWCLVSTPNYTEKQAALIAGSLVSPEYCTVMLSKASHQHFKTDASPTQP